MVRNVRRGTFVALSGLVLFIVPGAAQGRSDARLMREAGPRSEEATGVGAAIPPPPTAATGYTSCFRDTHHIYAVRKTTCTVMRKVLLEAANHNPTAPGIPLPKTLPYLKRFHIVAAKLRWSCTTQIEVSNYVDTKNPTAVHHNWSTRRVSSDRVVWAYLRNYL